MHRFTTALLALIACLTQSTARSEAPPKVTFDEHIKPIFRQHCAVCHNQDDPASGLAVDDYDAALVGGAGGEALASGDPDGSRLWRLVNHDEEPVMPPGADKLPAEQLALIRAWIDGGLLKNDKSKPLVSKKPKIAAVAVAGVRPKGAPTMPESLYREPLVTGDAAGPIDSLTTSPWAPLVATPWQRQVSLYHSETARLLGVVPFVDGSPSVVRFSRDGKLLLVAGGVAAASGVAALFDVETGARMATVGDELDSVLAADISPDNSLIAIGGPKKKVRVYRTDDGQLAYEFGKHTDWITAVAFSPNGELLATGDRSAGLRLLEARRGFERNDLRGHNQAITSLAWRDDGAMLASASKDGSVRLWDATGNSVKSVSAHGGGVESVRFAHDGRMVTAGRDKAVKTWQADGAPIAELTKTPDIALAAEFTHDGRRVVASDWSGTVRLIDVESKAEVATLPPNPPTLAQRAAELEQRVGALRGELAGVQKDRDAAVAALEEGRAAHAQYEARLHDAETAVADAQGRSERMDAALKTRYQEWTAAIEALSQAEQAVAAAEARLSEAREAATGAEDQPAEVADLEAVVTSVRAVQSAAAAATSGIEELRKKAASRAETVRVELATKREQLALLADQRTGLPDLAQLESTADQREQSVQTKQESLASVEQESQEVAKEREDFASALEQLTARAKQLEGERSQVQEAMQRVEVEQAAAQATLKTHEEEAERLKQRLEEIKTKLAAARGQRGEAAEALRQQEARAAEQGQALGAAERDAFLAESMREGFEAAERVREEYSEDEE